MGIFHPQEVLGPAGRALGHYTQEGCLHFLFIRLYLAIGFWMEDRGEAHQCAKQPAGLLPELGGKLTT